MLPQYCNDIMEVSKFFSATQLIEFPYGDGPEVVLGGGRRNFMKNTSVDPEYNTTYGKRKDGRDLISEWTKKNTKDNRYKYVWRNKDFSLLNASKVDHILGEKGHVSNLQISLVIRQKGESQDRCIKKTKHAKFSEKLIFLYLLILITVPPDTSVLKFALLP